MSEIPDFGGSARREALAIASELIAYEAALLDERRWDEWLALLVPDCEYWVPTWIAEDELASDPRRHLSHIYYASRAPLEDRIARIRSGRAAAVVPLRRSAHVMANILVESCAPERIETRSSMTCHNFDPHGETVDVLFGWTRHSLLLTESGWRIARKKTVLLNDTMPSSVDVYSL